MLFRSHSSMILDCICRTCASDSPSFSRIFLPTTAAISVEDDDDDGGGDIGDIVVPGNDDDDDGDLLLG